MCRRRRIVMAGTGVNRNLQEKALRLNLDNLKLGVDMIHGALESGNSADLMSAVSLTQSSLNFINEIADQRYEDDRDAAVDFAESKSE